MMEAASTGAAFGAAGSSAQPRAGGTPSAPRHRWLRGRLFSGFHWRVLGREARLRLDDGLWPGYTAEAHHLIFDTGRYPLAMREATAIWRGFALASLGPPLLVWLLRGNTPMAAILLLLIGGLSPAFLAPIATASAELARRRARNPTPHALRELAMLPLKPAAAKWLLYAPHAAALSAGAKLFSVSVFLSCAADGLNYWWRYVRPWDASVWQSVAGGLSNLDLFQHWLPLLAVLLLAIAWRRFALAAPLAGWSLSIRFPLPLAMPLAFLLGGRVACCTLLAIAPFWLNVGNTFLAIDQVAGVGHAPLLIALSLGLFVLLAQTADVGFYLPRDWAREDDKRLNRAGPEALEKPGDFRDWADMARRVARIAWPCPAPGRVMPLAMSRRRLIHGWRDEARSREERPKGEGA